VGVKWWIGGLVCAFALAGCSDGEPRVAGTTAPTERTPGAEVSPEATATPAANGPLRKTYARGETVDIERGVLFLDPKTGGGEAWEGVHSSPSGKYVWWNGADGKQPPVLFETVTSRKTELDTGGQFGTVLAIAPDDSEVAVQVGEELLFASTTTGELRLRYALEPGSIFPAAAWGAD
jgi:hypothetical protein